MSFSRETMIKYLQTGNCRVVFTKINGEVRDMLCTLQEEVLPELKTKPDDQKRQPNNSIVRAFDLNKKEFRSFRVENVTSFEFSS